MITRTNLVMRDRWPTWLLRFSPICAKSREIALLNNSLIKIIWTSFAALLRSLRRSRTMHATLITKEAHASEES